MTTPVGSVQSDVNEPEGGYSAARPVYSEGKPAHPEFNQRGDATVMEQYIPSYEDNANGGAHTFERAIADSLGAWTPYNSGTVALVGTAGIVIKNGAGRLRRLSGINTSTTVDYFLCAVDKATAPVNGDAVLDAIPLPRSAAGVVGSGSRDYPGGLRHSAGISYVISSTPNVVTLSLALAASVSAQFA